MASDTLGRPPSRRSWRPRLALALLGALLAVVSGCGRQDPSGPSAASAPATVGLEVALGSGNAALMSKAIVESAERVALVARRLVIRDDAPGGGERWRFRHDKITDYFLYRAFQTVPERQAEHLADGRFIGVYVLMARKMPREQARKMLTEIYWVAGRTEDFTIGKAFQEALEQKLAIQDANAAARNLSRPPE